MAVMDRNMRREPTVRAVVMSDVTSVSAYSTVDNDSVGGAPRLPRSFPEASLHPPYALKFSAAAPTAD